MTRPELPVGEAGELDYWRTALAGLPPSLDLPADRDRPPVPTYRGAALDFRLAPELGRAVRYLGRERGATLFATVLAAFKVVLARYAGRSDIAVGSLVAARDRGDVDDLVGFFVNTLVLRTDLSGDPSFAELVERVRDTTLGALGHQDLPFEQLVEELCPVRDLSRNPLVQVAFQVLPPQLRAVESLGGEVAVSDLAGLSGAGYAPDAATTRFDLELIVAEGADGGLGGSVLYAADLFDAPTVERLVGHLVTVLEAVAADPGSRLSQLPMLTEAELSELAAWNDTAAPFPAATVTSLIEDRVAASPEAVAVSCGQHRLTYAELDARATRLGAHLAGIGVEPESVVGLCVERGVELVVAVLGIWKAGGAYLPLDPSFPPERLAFMVADADAAVLLTQKGLLGRVPAGSAKVVCLDADAEAEAPLSALACPAGPGNLAYVIYTSGSTGVPKGVLVEHAALVNFLCAMATCPGLGPTDVVVALTTVSFDIAALELYLPLVVGAQVVVAPREVAHDPAALAALFDEAGASVVQATPATWRMLVDSGWAGRAGLRALCGGEALAPDLAERLVARVSEVWNLYGPTEATVWASVCRVHAGEAPHLGWPIANMAAHVLDESLRPLPVGVAGELYLGGVGLARGYHDRPELTAERFVAHPFDPDPAARLYRTGDVVRRRADGALEFLGRVDHQVKLRGFRIELGEIEAALAGCSGVAAAVVVAREDRPGDVRLVGYLLAEGDAPGPEALRAQLGRRLPAYMVPSAFLVLEEFPLTPNHKVDRKALPAPEAPRGGGAGPATATEAAVAAIWAEVLGLAEVGAGDDFFALGGHSLLATQVVALVRERLGAELGLRAVFEAATVAGLAAHIDACIAARIGAARPAPAELPPLVALDRSLFIR